jgi:RNA polymerase sigma-70 factor (ECF subfamily)
MLLTIAEFKQSPSRQRGHGGFAGLGPMRAICARPQGVTAGELREDLREELVSTESTPSPLSEDIRAAIHALRADRPEALVPLVDRYGPGLHRFLFQRVKRAAQADDLFQEVWHQVLISHGRLRDPERFPSWLYGIARNVAASAGRRTRREVSLESLQPGDDAEGDFDVPDPKAANPRESAQSGSVRARMDALLEELSDPAREMITLRFYDGLTTGQISEALDVPIGTVCSTVHRGLLRLRDLLKREGLTLEDLR